MSIASRLEQRIRNLRATYQPHRSFTAVLWGVLKNSPNPPPTKDKIFALTDLYQQAWAMLEALAAEVGTPGYVDLPPEILALQERCNTAHYNASEAKELAEQASASESLAAWQEYDRLKSIYEDLETQLAAAQQGFYAGIRKEPLDVETVVNKLEQAERQLAAADELLMRSFDEGHIQAVLVQEAGSDQRYEEAAKAIAHFRLMI